MICSVCFEKGEQEKISGDRGHTLLKCSKCELLVHLRCYGERNPHLRKTTHKNSEEELFDCEKCINKDQSCACVICHIKDGYMVRIELKKYVHVICALFTDHFEVVDFLKMKIEAKISLKDIEKINSYVNNKNQCDICQNSQGVLLECECETNSNIDKPSLLCCHKAHLYCAMRDKFIKLRNDPDSTNYWQIDWKFNYKGTQLDDKQDVYNKNLLSLKNQADYNQSLGTSNTNSNINNDNMQGTIEVGEIAGNSCINKSKKKGKNSGISKKSGKKTNSSEEILANSRSLTLDSSKNEEEILINFLSTKFTHTNEKNWILKNRGGEIKVLCEDHREQVIYCICRKSSGTDFMICCDNCETWFHGRCLGLSNKEINTLKKWYCSFCTEWINNRNNFLLKEANEDINEDLINQAKGKSWKMPVIHNHLQYKVIDLLFITILYWRKGEILINHSCSLEILSKHIKLGYEIPFNLSNIILQLKKKEHKFINRNFEAEKKILEEIKNFPFGEIELIKNKIVVGSEEEMNDGEVSSDIREEIEINWENYKVIENYYNILQSLHENIHETSEGIIHDNISFIESAWKKFKWAKSAFEIVSKQDSESSLQDVKSIYLTYTDIFLNNNMSKINNQGESNPITQLNKKPFEREFSLITKYMTDYSSWQKSTKEMLSNHMKRKNEAEKVLQDIETKIKKEEANLINLNNSGNSSNYLPIKISIINKHKEKMRINFDTKIPIQKIREIIQIGRCLKINASKEIESIDSCLNEALEWDSTFLKTKNQNSLKLEEIQKLIQSCTNILVCTPNMYEAIEIVFAYEFFLAKLENFLLNEKNSEIINSDILNEITSDYEINFQRFKDDLIQQKIDAFFKIREKIQKLKEVVKDSLNNNNDIKILNKLGEALEKENKNFVKEEMEKLKQKIFYLRNIEDLLNQKNDLKSLEVIETLIDEYNINTAIDCNLKEKINLKKEKIFEIQHKISQILNMSNNQSIENNLTIDEEMRKLQGIKDEIESNKIQLEEQKKIEDIITLIEWFKIASSEFLYLLNIDDTKNNLLENFDLNSQKDLLKKLVKSISEIEKFYKENEPNLQFEIRIFYEKLLFLIWQLKAVNILKIIKNKENNLKNSENNSENLNLETEHEQNEKIEINELYSLLDENSNSQFLNFYSKNYQNYFAQLKNISDQVNDWLNTFKLLNISIFEEGVKNLELCKKLFNLLQADQKLTNKINLNSEHSKLSEISSILKICEKLNTILETKNIPMENRFDKERIIETLKDCEIKLSNDKIKMPIRQFYFFQEINKELEKFESWIENYQQYIHHKRNNQADKIDFGFLEVLQEEAKKILVNLNSEVGILKRDLELNKNWIHESKSLIEISENLNNVDKIIDNPEFYENLQKVFSQLTNNQVAIPEKNFSDMVKALEWAARARSLLKNLNPIAQNKKENSNLIPINGDKLNYRIAFRTSQEANSLKFFYEIKKKDYYTDLMSQVTLAKNIKDISEILKNSTTINLNHHMKQIPEEQFDKIVKDFLNKCVVDLPEEREIVENFIKTKLQFEKKFENYVMNKSNLNDYEKLSAELKKFPVNLEKLIFAVENIINENKFIMKEIRKIMEHFNSGKCQMLLKEKIQAIYEKYKNNKASFVEGEQLAKMFESSEDKIKKLKANLINNENRDMDIYDLINLLDTIEIHNLNEEKVLKKKLWRRKFYSFVENEGESNFRNSSNPSPSFVVVRNLVTEANELNILECEENCNGEYNKLLEICERAQEIIKEILSCKNLEELETVKKKIQKEDLKTDLGDFLIEQETRLSLNKILPLSQVTRNLENLFLGIKRKNEEKLRHSNTKKSYDNIGIKSIKKLEDDGNFEIIKNDSVKDQENFPVREDVSLIFEGEINIQNGASMHTPSLANTRSKRKVNLKLDKDYFYDKEFLENFENKIANRRLKKAGNIVDASYEEKLEENSGINEELRENERNDHNLPITLKESNKKEPSTNLVPTNINDSKTNLIKNLIKKNPASHIPLEIPKKEENILIHHNPLRQNLVETFIKILHENPTFNKEGSEYIKKLGIELEEELYKTYNKLDPTYKSGFENMSKTVKELEKYKRVSILVTKGKLNLPKVAKFPYGPKYFEKLKKIDESVQSQITQKNKRKDEKEEKEEGKVSCGITNLENIDLSEIQNKSQTQYSTAQEKKGETNLISLMSDMDKLYSSLHKSNKNEIKISNKSKSISELVIEMEEASKNLNDDNESLKSVSDKADVRFSPDGGNHLKSVGSNVFTTTAKSSNVQSPSSPNHPNYLKKEISIISTFENIYNPFEIEEDFKEKEDFSESNSNVNMNIINVKYVRSSTQNLKKNLIQPIFYDPFKKSGNLTTDITDTAFNKSKGVNLAKKSSANFNTILQVWKGNVSVSRLNLKNILMCSTNASKSFAQFQKLPNDININSKAKTKEVIPYIERYLANKSDKISYGWFEIEDESEIDAYQALADDYDKNDRSGFNSFKDAKYYIFTLSKRYPKFYKKMKNEFRIHNKSLMNQIDKLIVYVIIRKNEANNDMDVEEYSKSNDNCIEPIVLKILVEKKENTEIKLDNKKVEATANQEISLTKYNTNTNLTKQSSENIQMSPITSDEEENEEENEDFSKENINDAIKNIPESNSNRKDYLQELLDGDDLEKLEEYVNNQFANLSQEEIIQKLMSLDESSRAKLLNMIMQYQQRVASNVQERNENEEIDREEEEDEIEEENIEKNSMEIDDSIQTYQVQSDIKPTNNTRINDHLSYLGFSSSNASTDLLKKEILKNQSQGQSNQNVETVINEDIIKKNMNLTIGVSMNNQTNPQMFNPYMNMNYPMMNMNQAYMLNPNYSQNMNYHQLGGVRPHMQMMMPHGANYNQMMMQNMGNVTNLPNQPGYNMNIFNQRANMQNNKNNNLNK